jgi:homoserine dehydrogenase
MKRRLLIIGFGNVGRELARILTADPNTYPRIPNSRFSVVGVTTASRGSLASSTGVDVNRALDEITSRGFFGNSNPDFSRLDSAEAVARLDYDILVELSTLSIVGRGEPALSYLKTALNRGKHCVTANKGPLAFSAKELLSLAARKGKLLLYEATVMDGTPIFNMARSSLMGCRVQSIEGVVNSTTNYVLSRLTQGQPVADAVKSAQRQGFAEADPEHDLEGWDAAAKICVLANVLMGADLTPFEVHREGLSSLHPSSLEALGDQPSKIRMIARAEKVGRSVEAGVVLEEIADDHPFSFVSETGCALRIETDLLGPLLIQQQSPTLTDTAYGVLNDLMELIR